MENILFVDESIKYLFAEEYRKLIEIEEINLASLNKIVVNSNESVDNNIKSILNKKPIELMNLLFDDVASYPIKQEVEFYNISEIENEKYNATIRTKIDNFSILTHTEYIKIQFFENEIEWFNVGNINLDVVSINYFTGEIVLSGIFSVNKSVTDFYTVDSMTKIITFHVMGFDKGHQKSWLENIFAGALYQEAKNMRMAYFSIFSGLDDFINRIYDISFTKLLENYSSILSELTSEIHNELRREILEREHDTAESKTIDLYGEFEFNKKKLSLIGYDISNVDESEHGELGDEYDEFVAEKCRKAVEQVESDFDEGKFDEEIEERTDIVDAKDYLKKIIKSYSMDRRLRERIGECSKSIQLTKEKHARYYSLLKKFDEYEKKRHDIAHGRSLDNIPIQDFLYYVLSIILSVSYQEDFAHGGWNKYLAIK